MDYHGKIYKQNNSKELKMSQKYSRSNRHKKSDTTTDDSSSTVVTKAKHGFTAVQKLVALLGSILSIIVATITINNSLHKPTKPNNTQTNSSTTITKIIEKEKTVPTPSINTDKGSSSETVINKESGIGMSSSSSNNTSQSSENKTPDNTSSTSSNRSENTNNSSSSSDSSGNQTLPSSTS